MDSRRFVLAIILMVAVMVITNLIFPPVKPKTAAIAADSAAMADSIARAASTTGANGNATGAGAQPAGSEQAGISADSTAQIGTTAGAANSGVANSGAANAGLANAAGSPSSQPADTVFVESPLYRYGFSTRGGALVKAEILQHALHTATASEPGQPVDLAALGGRSLVSYKVLIGNKTVDLSQLSFTAIPPEGMKVAIDGTQQLRLIHSDSAAGFQVEIDYDFSPNTYLIDTHATVRATGDRPAKLLIALGPNLAQTEADSAEDARHRAYVVSNTENGIHDVTFQRFSKNAQTVDENGPFNWVAIRSKYFVAAVLESDTAKTPFAAVNAKPVPGRHGADLTASLIPGNDGRFSFRVYVGPQEPKLLEAIGGGFKDINPFGWRWARPILRPVGHGVAALLYGMHDLFGISYGWVLVLFGVLIRVLLWPLNAKAMRSQMKNMEMQPRIKDIQTRYKKDPERLQKEMLKLYKEEGFNPMGGCLPSLIPFPILITLYFVFANAIAFRGVSFLWMPDLSRPDPLYILPVLLGASMFVLQWFSTRGATGDQTRQMKVMMYTMPPFMTFIFLRFAAGLNLYYAAMNLASIPQQMQIMRERERFKAARAGQQSTAK
jgi:YidC/Oxa1 family membrane protein insertase